MEINNPFFRVAKLLSTPGLLDSIKNKQYNPVNATIHPTLKCSCSCLNCLYKEVMHQNLSLDIEILDKAIDLFSSMGVKTITISGGGEPLLGEPSVIAKIVKSGFTLGLNTSLAFRPNKNMNIVADNLNKFSWVRLSLDAYDAQSYEDRRKCNLFNEVMSNLNRLLLQKKLNCPDVTIGIAILVDRELLNNIGKLKETLSSSVKKGLIEQIDYILLRPFVRHHDNDNIDYEYIHDLNRTISFTIHDFQRQKLPLIYHYDKFKYVQEYVENRMDRKSEYCYGSLANIILGADGQYYRCCEFVYNDKFAISAENKETHQIFDELQSWDIDAMSCPPFCKHFSINEFVESINAYTNKHLYFI